MARRMTRGPNRIPHAPNAFAPPKWLSFGKLRMSYGEAGQEPAPYLTSTIFNGTVLLGGITQGTGNSPTQAGLGGLSTSNVKGAENLRPERTKETEGGIDIGRPAVTGIDVVVLRGEVLGAVPLEEESGLVAQLERAADGEGVGEG